MDEKTKQYYEPGEILYRGKFFARAISRSSWDEVCGCCLRRSFTLRRCSRCHLIKYCGKECQKQAWEDHKLECPHLHKLPKINAVDSFIQLIGNCILKLKGKDWSKVVEKVMGQEVNFEDHPSRRKLGKKPYFDKIYLEYLEKQVKSYVGEENYPGHEKFMKIAKKVCGYAILQNPSRTIEVFSFYLGAFLFEISCVPNCVLYDMPVDFRFLVIKATKRIHKNQEKCTLDISDILAPESFMRYENDKRYLGDHKFCTDCAQPYGFSPLTKILDVPKSIQVIRESTAMLQSVSLISGEWNVLSRRNVFLKASQMLKMQEGVLADTNLLRIRMRYLRSQFFEGDVHDLEKELKELIRVVKQVWGENFEDLLPLYLKLVDVNVCIGNISEVHACNVELQRLTKVYELRNPTINLRDDRFGFGNFFLPFLIPPFKM